jgi:aldehyde:ferredoxin oxidoreductase
LEIERLLGYAGRVLYVDLSTGKTRTEKLPQETAKKYIGGIGLGMYFWLSNSKAGVDPLSPENPLVIAVGPVGGTMFPTGGNGHAFITGKAKKPVYLWIDDDRINLKDAEHLWGREIGETEDAIKEEIGDFYIRVASIGLAGEKQSKIANIINDVTRAAGRTGLGAVMGSKNLKAIAVRGTNDVSIAKPDEFFDMVEDFHERMKGPAAQKHRTLGTIQNLTINNDLTCLPTNNFSSSHFINADKINAEVLNEHFIQKIIACNSCAMRCEHTAILKEGTFKGTMARMEFDNLWAFGPNCGVDNINYIIKASQLCSAYGLDATSTGGVIAFLMDCHERGLLSHEELEGIDPHFGNQNAVFALVQKIGKREGIGEKLADGVKVAAEKIGKNSAQLAMHIKGLELTGYDLRCLKTTALAAAVSFRGADHSRSGVYSLEIKGTVDRLKAEKGRGEIVKDFEDIVNILDSLIVCKNAKGTFNEQFADMAKLYNLVTGFEVTPQEMHEAGERIEVLAKLINMREGLTRKDDNLPWKILNQPIVDDGIAKGSVITQDELDMMLDDYYEARGWDNQGVPTKAKLKELGIEAIEKVN